PVANAVYKQQSNPVAKVWEPKERLSPVGAAEYPHILSTYRLTEHHLSGSMSRWLPWLAELQPELFAEISPEHAEELGVRNTDLSVCIGCKACQVACHQWNDLPADLAQQPSENSPGRARPLTGNSYDNTGSLSANNWRHVKFIEQFNPERTETAWLMMSDVC